MIAAINSAVKGLSIQKERVNEAADNIANFSAKLQKAEELYSQNNIDPSTFKGLDINLELEILELLDASNLYKANAAVIRTENEIFDELLDLDV